MVVNRYLDGTPKDICDSLLFTSLYFISLKKLGYLNKAEQVWFNIEASQTKGKWLRHPDCPATPTSRDMILGVLAAFTQEVPNMRSHLVHTLQFVRKNRGFIANGRPDISFLAPGVAEFFRIYANALQISPGSRPLNIQLAFPTSEFSTLLADPGYRTHLIALQSWIELELREKAHYREHLGHRQALAALKPLTKITGIDPRPQRISWITQTIYGENRDNLFFKYLRLKSAGALTRSVRSKLISDLLAMPQFPSDRLPEDCDRKADYLWQRASDEYHKASPTCRVSFNGVDFLWMAALLLDHHEPIITEDSHHNKAWN